MGIAKRLSWIETENLILCFTLCKGLMPIHTRKNKRHCTSCPQDKFGESTVRTVQMLSALIDILRRFQGAKVAFFFNKMPKKDKLPLKYTEFRGLHKQKTRTNKAWEHNVNGGIDEIWTEKDRILFYLIPITDPLYYSRKNESLFKLRKCLNLIEMTSGALTRWHFAVITIMLRREAISILC